MSSRPLTLFVLAGALTACSGAGQNTLPSSPADGPSRVCIEASDALRARMRDTKGNASGSALWRSPTGTYMLCFDRSAAGQVTLDLEPDPNAVVINPPPPPKPPRPVEPLPVEPPKPDPPAIKIPETMANAVVLPQTFQDSAQIPVLGSPTRGAANPKVVMVVFSEFQCPFCSRVTPALDALLKKYPNDLAIVFKHNPLSFHKDAPLAAEASHEAFLQGKFWEYHDYLFANQRRLKREDLEEYARRLGLNMDRFKAALDERKHREVIARDQKVANEVGARGTPNSFLNGRKITGAKPTAAFVEEVEAELAKLKKLSKFKSTYKARVASNWSAPEVKKRAPKPSKQDQDRYNIPLQGSPVRGNSQKAIVTIVEFSDFQCPFCTRAHNTLKRVQDHYGDRVRIVHKNLPLSFHKRAEPAAIAALAAKNQGKFWEYYDILMANQRRLSDDDFMQYARRLGLNMNRFKRDLTSKALQSIVKRDVKTAGTFGVRGTPHFFVNGQRLSGAQPFEKFSAAIDQAIQDAAPLTKKGLRGDRLYRALMRKAKTSWKNPQANKKPADDTRYVIPIGTSPTLGPKNAPVTMVIFSDFQCPFCARLEPTLKQIQKAYRGKVRFVFKHQPLPFHQDAPLAAEASMAAHEQGKFWEYHDLLFANYRNIKREDLEKYARQLGLNITRFREALDSGRYKDAVKEDIALASKVGARGTPTSFINGIKVVGLRSFDDFKTRIEAELLPKWKRKKRRTVQNVELLPYCALPANSTGPEEQHIAFYLSPPQSVPHW